MTPREFPAEVVERVAQRRHERLRSFYPLSITLPWGAISAEDKEAAREHVRVVLSALSPAAAAVVRGEAVAVPRDGSEDAREEIASVLEAVARDGLPGPRDLDAALDAIFCTIAAQEPPR